MPAWWFSSWILGLEVSRFVAISSFKCEKYDESHHWYAFVRFESCQPEKHAGKDCERPLAQSFGHNLFTVQEREVQVIDLDKGLKGVQVGSCKRASNAMTSGLKSLQFNAYNPSETNILVYYTQDGGCYDLFVGPNNITNDTSISPKQGNAQAVCFTARNRFAVLQPGGSIGIYNLQNELSKKFDMPISVDYIFPGENMHLIFF